MYLPVGELVCCGMYWHINGMGSFSMLFRLPARRGSFWLWSIWMIFLVIGKNQVKTVYRYSPFGLTESRRVSKRQSKSLDYCLETENLLMMHYAVFTFTLPT